MAAPFTQAFIQAKIDFFAAQLEVATQSQQYSYDRGPAGQFGVEKAKLESIEKSLQTWLDRMDRYYPDAFEEQPQIYSHESGYKIG